MTPYDGGMILKLLRAMPAAKLATLQPQMFQTWPAQVILPAKVIGQLIANERLNRGAAR